MAGFGPPMLAFTNTLYSTPAAMAQSAKLATQGVKREDFQWGHYQQKVEPDRNNWPTATRAGKPINHHDEWLQHIANVRNSLAQQGNTDHLAPDETHHVPPTRMHLLDEAVRKAFYSDPPIPMTVAVDKAKGAHHHVEIAWDTDAQGNPTMLRFTVHCP